MNISKSRIKTLETCPLLFKFQYIEHRKPDIPKASVTQIGIDIHDIFNKFFDNISLEKIPDEPYEYFCNSMPNIPLQYRSIFNHFCKVETDVWKLIDDKKYFFPIFREKSIMIDGLTGIIDRVDFDGKDYSIIDYKSSASNPSNLRFELCFYKNLIEKVNILDKPITYVGVYGYRTGDIFFEKIKNVSFNNMLKKVEAFRNLEFDNLNYYPKKGGACNWCEYPTSCAEYQKYKQVSF